MPTRNYLGTKKNDRLYDDKGSVLAPENTVEMRGLDGDDLLAVSSFTNATIRGGSGNDTLEASNFGDKILYGDGGNDILEIGFANDSDETYELHGGSGRDSLTSTLTRENSGAEVILDGGSGADRLTGDDCRDIYVVDNKGDVIFETYTPEYDNSVNPRDEVRAKISWTLGANLEDLLLLGGKKINGNGNSLGNTIEGNSARNKLSGEAGGDSISGGKGSDKILGGGGKDMLHGDAGKDRLDGGAGKDQLFGGRGDDHFIFSSHKDTRSSAADTIRGEAGVAAFEGAGRKDGDLIDLRGIDAKLTVNGDQDFSFDSRKQGGVWLETRKGDTIVFGNNDKDRDADFKIVIKDGDVGHGAYSADDFLL